MRKQLILATAILTSAVVAPVWAAGQGRTSGQVSQTTSAQAGQTGLTTRANARANSQGPTHASQTAIDRVQNSPGQANNNSVLGNGGTTSTTGTTTSTGDTSMTADTTASGDTTDTGVGVSRRATARANSQGPAHASQNAIDHVQNSPGQANNNSVLGNGGTTSTTTTTATTAGTTTASGDISSQTRASTGGKRVATTKTKKPRKH